MKRFLPLLILIVTLISVTGVICLASENFPAPLADSSADEGRTFTKEDRLQISNVITEMPKTFEATIKLPANLSGNGGTIVSNYDSGYKANTFILDVNSNGSPQLTVRYDTVDANRHTYKFSNVKLKTGEWLHLAIVRDGDSLHCYVDGVLAETLAYTCPDITMTREIYVGGDLRRSGGKHNYDYFKGEMKNVALYSDVRTSSEIASDMSEINVEDDNLIAYYELSGTKLADIIPDQSKANNHIICDSITGGLELSETDNKSKNRYLAKKITEDYQTIEVMVKVDEGEYGVLYGNNNGAPSPNSVNFEITSAGAIKYHAYDTSYVSGSKLYNAVTFNNVKINTGEWVHVTLVCDRENAEYRCYVNGSLAQAMDMSNQLNLTPPRAMYLGRDYRTGALLKQYNGEIMSLVTYSDVRSTAEIIRDISCGPEYDENLISYYDMKFADDSATIPDRSGNGADLVNPAKPVNELKVEGNGITVDTNALKYSETYAFGSIPHTIECTFKLDYANRSGTKTILSNYKSSTVKSYTYSLRLVDGVPRLLLYYSNDSSILEYKFTSVSASKLCTGNWVNIALTMDTVNKEFKFYINGTLAQTLAFSKDSGGKYNDSIDLDFKFVDPILLGSSYATGGAAYPFSNGVIKSVVTYSDVRTAEEIAGDFYFPGTDGMTAYWDASLAGVYKAIPDRSNNFNAMKVNNADTITYDNETNAMTFAKDKYYEASSKLEATPLTIEAMVKYPLQGSNKGSQSLKGCSIENVIFGNFYGKTTANALNFGINKACNPMIYMIDHLGNIITYSFDEVTVNTEYWEHIAITFDEEAGFAYCYQNGVLKQKIYYNGELSDIDCSDNKFAHVLGGDWQSERREYYNRKLGYLALYTDIRSAEEIYADAKDGISTDDEGLICYYDCRNGDTNGVISDNKSGKYDLNISAPFYEKEELDPDSYDYSIAIVGDTQNLTYSYNSALTSLYDWIVANAKSKKIGFVMGLGDINEKDSDKEWSISSVEIEKLLNAGIPQSLVCGGNHDTIPQFNKYLPYTKYVEGYEGKVVYGFYDDGTGNYSLSNAYHLITIGETPYMFLTLEWAPKPAHVAWANEVIAAHPEYNVIISTHAYLADDGTRFNTWHHATPDRTGKQDAHNGEELWNELVRKHENIVMFIGGHDPSAFVVKREVYGDHGNRIVEMLINPQHTDIVYKGTGMVAMLYFSGGGKNVNLEYYSTVKEMYYREENQFSFEMPKVTAEGGSISQASVSIADDIRINYYARLTGKYENATMRFTLNGNTYTATPTATEYDGLYRFVFNGIAPQLMGDTIVAELVYDGKVIDTANEFSIENYLKTLLKMDRYQLAVTASRCNALHALATELLNYGAAAQIYRDYNTSALVNSGITGGAEFDADSVVSHKAQTTPAGNGSVKFKAATVRFDSINSLRFDFVIGDSDISLITVKIGEKTYTEADFISSGDGIYSIYTDGIAARDFDVATTATLLLDGEEMHSVTYSVNSYVKSMHQSDSMGTLARAIYNYGVAAKAFINAYS